MSVTIVIKFSRDWCLNPFVENFHKLIIPKGDFKLLVINNSSSGVITHFLMSAVEKSADKFKEIRFLQTDAPKVDRYKPENFKDVPLPFQTNSAKHSFNLQKVINSLVTDDIHIQLEDDTLSHPDLIPKLMKLMEDDHVICATSPCPHRQKGFKVVGHNAYNIMEFNDEGFLLRRSNHPVCREGIKSCEATGYCGCAFRKKYFEEAIKFIENLKFRIIGSGSDIYFTNSMLQKGKVILCDFSIWNKHIYLEDGQIKTNTVENCKPWDWTWNKRKRSYNLKFIEET